MRRPSDPRSNPRPGRAVPSRRLSRAMGLGRTAGGIASGMAWNGLRQFASGRRPRLDELFLTPANIRRLTDRLADMRGAAMKIGQLISMDAGEFLPPELADIMERLRADADPMPPRQLRRMLASQWGPDWNDRFTNFEMTPIAAASIGQVHRAETADGRVLAIKVQYPGVRSSIDSDVDNVGFLLRSSGLVSDRRDIDRFLQEGKAQLHAEADYLAEAEHLKTFGSLLAADDRFTVPTVDDELTTRSILAMSFEDGIPLESLRTAPSELRNRIVADLVDLLLRELFEFRLLQSDPNLANYRYDEAGGRIVLLDFGATVPVTAERSSQFADLLEAGMSGDRIGAQRAFHALGYLDRQVPRPEQEAVMDLVERGFGELRSDGAFDFGDRALTRELRDRSIALSSDPELWPIPPVDAVIAQRKIAGTYLLGAKLAAKVDVGPPIERHLRAMGRVT